MTDVPQTLWADTLRLQVLSRLRAAIAVAAAGTPLAGVYIPPSRFYTPQLRLWPELVVRTRAQKGRNVDESPATFTQAATLEIVGACAAGREEQPPIGALDLDTQAGQLVQACFELLLGDTTFLAFVSSIGDIDVDFFDGDTGGDGKELDVVAFVATLSLTLKHEIFTARAPADAADFTTLTTVAQLGVAPGSNPPAQHSVGDETEN
jgi:hypothetical protein